MRNKLRWTRYARRLCWALCIEGGSTLQGKAKVGVSALILGAGIAVVTAVAHTSCMFFGPSCYQAQMAPKEIVQSAIDGTWIAPIGTIFISALFMLCAAYALSAAGIIKRLPLQGLGIYCIAALCVTRGAATLPLSFMFPDMVSNFSLLSGAVWFMTGLLFFFGYRCAR